MDSKEIEMMTILDSMSVNLPVDICIDTEGFNKPLCVYFRNGYNRHIDEWLPILVCENPKRIGDDKLKITQVDYYDVEEFVAKYAETLVDITLDKKDFYNDILLVCDRNNLNESHYLLKEMAILRQNHTGLKKRIWLDTGKTFEKGGHYLRIKVQTGNTVNSHEWATLTIPEYKWVGDETISTEDKKEIERYAKANVGLITSLTFGEIKLQDYLQSSYKINNKGFAVKPETAVEWVYAYPAKFGVDIYKRNVSPYRYMYSKDGIESLYKDEQGKPIYFPNAQPYDDTGKTYVTSNGEWYLIQSNGDYSKV